MICPRFGVSPNSANGGKRILFAAVAWSKCGDVYVVHHGANGDHVRASNTCVSMGVKFRARVGRMGSGNTSEGSNETGAVHRSITNKGFYFKTCGPG